MDKDAIQLLEQKIDRIITQYQDLKKENSTLKSQQQELQLQNQNKDNLIRDLQAKISLSQASQTELESYKVQHDTIQNKVESLINKLKEFEDA